jgi:hypothetical protein
MGLITLIQPVSILIEAAIVVIACLLGARRRMKWGWFLAATFAIYVLYDTARLLALDISPDILAVVFFIASVSALCAVWLAYFAEPERGR